MGVENVDGLSVFGGQLVFLGGRDLKFKGKGFPCLCLVLYGYTGAFLRRVKLVGGDALFSQT